MPHGSSSKIVLSDSTVVWLNAGSNLIYPSNFTGNTREVVLFGEAFFNVKGDKSKPFIVQTSAIEIKVLGTKFNISAYPEDNIIQTVLKEGKVSIREIGTNKIEKEIFLVPNQLASFDKKTKLTEVKNVNTDFYTSWTDGLLSFENRDLNRVIKSLERYYDVNIQFENPMLGMVKISGKLDLKQNRNEVFEYLAKVSSTTFEKKDERNYKIR
jgi:ferric-dicitrate binding protein FerR (iron transport regulator)